MSRFAYRYGGTYVSIDRDGVRYPVQVRDTEDTDVFVYKYSEVEKNWQSVCTRKSSLNLEIPKLGMVQVGDGVVYVTRSVLRRYKRGLDAENLRVFSPSPLFNASYIDTRDYKFLKAVYNPVYCTAEEAEDALRSGKASGKAININTALVIAAGINDPVLYYANKPAGFIRGGVITIHPKFDYVGWELADEGICCEEGVCQK